MDGYLFYVYRLGKGEGIKVARDPLKRVCWEEVLIEKRKRVRW